MTLLFASQYEANNEAIIVRRNALNTPPGHTRRVADLWDSVAHVDESIFPRT